MVFKWTLVVFGVAAGALFVLGKVLVPLAIAVGLLVLALGGKP